MTRECFYTITEDKIKMIKHIIIEFDIVDELTYPVATSQIFMVLSRLEDTRKSPEGKKVTLLTLWSCPCKVFMQSKVLKSHSFTDMSALQEAVSKHNH